MIFGIMFRVEKRMKKD